MQTLQRIGPDVTIAVNKQKVVTGGCVDARISGAALTGIDLMD